jgi:hypothetical protein
MENPRALRRCQETQLQGREKPKARRVVRYVPSPPPKGLLEAGSVLMPCEGQVKDRERVCSGNEERGPYNDESRCSLQKKTIVPKFSFSSKNENLVPYI